MQEFFNQVGMTYCWGEHADDYMFKNALRFMDITE